MITTSQVQTLLRGGNATLVGQNGAKIGKVGQVFLDDHTSEPEWVTVTTGLFGGAESFVPLQGASIEGSRVTVPFDKDTVKGAPRVDDSEGHLSPDEEAELYRYYGIGYAETQTETGTGIGTGTRDTSALADGDDVMIRSEEQLHVGTRRVEAGRARLRKYIVTEQATRTVPLRHEEVRIEREPITDANRGDAVFGAELTSEEHEVVLTAERVVVDKEVVAVERVRLGTETVSEQRTVTEELRKEQIETEGLVDTTATTATTRTGTSGTSTKNRR